VRAAVDLCHRDGSLKQAVAKDPAKYIHEDSRLIGIMDMYRAAGKKLFVATNSLWDYTHVVMNFLLTGRVGSDRNEDWLEYFDVVITGQAGPCLNGFWYFVLRSSKGQGSPKNTHLAHPPSNSCTGWDVNLAWRSQAMVVCFSLSGLLMQRMQDGTACDPTWLERCNSVIACLAHIMWTSCQKRQEGNACCCDLSAQWMHQM